MLLNFLLLTFSLFPQSRDIQIQKYTVADGLSHNSVIGITQDKNGFMWFSTLTGIDRFDGYEFKNYATENSVFGDTYYFTKINTDRTGNLWTCSAFQKVFRYNDSIDRFDAFRIRNDIFHGSLQDIYFDHNNNMWIATGNGIAFLRNGADPSKYLLFTNFGHPSVDALKVNTIKEDNKGNIWMGCNEGLYMFCITRDSITGMFRYRFTGDDFVSDNENEVMTIYFDNNNHLWAGTYSDGIKEVDLSDNMIGEKSGRIKHRSYLFAPDKKKSIYNNGINCILPGEKGKLLIKNSRGIYLFDTRTGVFETLCTIGAKNPFDSDDGWVLGSMYYSPEGILWVGTNDGVYKVIVRNKRFHTINNFKPDILGIQPFKTSAVLSDSRDRLWIGTPGNGLHLGIKDKNGIYKFRQFKFDTLDNESIYFNKICFLTEAESGNIWISAGHFQLASGSDSSIKFIRKRRDRFRFPDYISSINVNQIFENNDKLWVLYNDERIKIYDTITWVEKEFGLSNGNAGYTNSYIVRSNDGRLFFRSQSGIYELSNKFIENDSLYYPLNVDTLLGKHITFPYGKFVITKTKGGLFFWIPSIDKGIYRYFLPDSHGEQIELNSNNLIYSENFSTDNGLSNNNIYDILEDKNGNIWVSTMNGLNMIHPLTKNIRSFYFSDGLPDNRFNYGACTDSNGILYFCNAGGVVKFHPDSLGNEIINGNTYITSIKLYNRNIEETNEINPGAPVFRLKQLKLRHYQNFLSFGFISINFNYNEHITYRYKLEGINSDWIESGKKRVADYPDLKPGKYVFRVIASENDGTWGGRIAQLKIEIMPPFWQRAWFIVLIVLLMVLGVIMIIRYREKNLRKKNIWLEKEVKEKTDLAIKHWIDLEEMKSRFYTNISHEFRTPLTLISASAMEIEKRDTGKTVSKFTATILNAGTRLLKLVNELLDLSKIEAGKLDLKVSEGDLAAATKLIWQTYISDAERRKIKYCFTAEPEVMVCWFDKEFIQKILHNLVSNALKFTGEGGMVEVRLKSDGTKTEMIVRDTGTGIREEHLSRIFDRFYQADNSNTREFEGTGIGLSIVQELVKRHYGEIKVKSSPGKGSEFMVIIPIAKERFEQSELSAEDNNAPSEIQSIISIPEEPFKPKQYNALQIDKKQILIVEDNDELRSFLSDQLSGLYLVIEASNGIDALKKANEYNPEIIISDIMMPEMDGIELCSLIKNQVETSHIPVILLTAKADIESKLEGLRTGADDYLTKPFNGDELIVRIENLLRQREKLKDKFLTYPLSEIPGLHTGSSDKEFISEMLEIIKNNLDKSDFSTDHLASALNLGKRTFQRKTKALTRLTPVELIRVVRIKYAAQLLTGKTLTVAEAAYATGFSSVSYFTKSFKEVMGVNPSDYIK